MIKQITFKKIILYCFLFLTFTYSLQAQNNNGAIDAPGDIAFVAYNDTPDGFAFILLDDCPNTTSIRFIDEEWTGAAFASTTSEGEVLWVNDTGSTILKGTVITIENADNDTSISASIGTATEDELGFTTANIDELFAVTGTRAAPGTFLSFIGDIVGNTLTGTGLTDGVNAQIITEEGYYSGSTTCNSTLGDCAAMINNSSNWTIGAFSFPTGVPTAFTGSAISSCTAPDTPTVSATNSSICTGNNTNLNITGSLNDATNWHIYTGSCGGTQIGTTATGTFNVSPTMTTTYYVRGEGGCVTPGSCSTVTVTVNNLDDASFSYGASSYCNDAADPTPTITGLGGGMFSSSAGLSLNGTTGQIDVSASTPGSYTVTYTTSGTCPNSSNASVTINSLDNASFNYSASSYASTDADPTPTITGLGGGTFSSTAGLSLNGTTGQIDVSASLPNTYTVTYTTNGTCPNSSNQIITITGTYIWNGSNNNDWHTSSNWNYNAVPSSSADIVIPSGITNYPTASSAVTFNTLTINSGASFIPQSTVTGSITYKRDLATTNWYLVSSPVSGETTQDIIANHTLASGTGGNLGFAPYSNITGSAWLYSQSGSTGTLTNGKGYSIKLATPGTVSFTGTANTSNVSTPISTGSRTNFNLLGNPYTSYINSASFSAANTAILASETIWLWDGTQYITKNAVDDIEIAPGQAFFVEASTSNNVIFSFSNQSHQGTDTFMKQEPIPSIELFVDNNEVKRSTKVFYLSNKTTGYDNGYDSKMFGEDNSKLAVFTELLNNNQGKHLAIQTLPNNDYENMIIPIGVKAKSGEEVIFSINSKNLPSNLNVYLEDKTTQTYTNLSKENYSITPTNDLSDSGRFYLYTSAKKLDIKLPIATSINEVKLYKPEGSSYIIVTGLQGKNIKLKMFSLSGKQVFNRTFSSDGYSEIKAPKLTSGVYLIELVSDLGKTSTKIILD